VPSRRNEASACSRIALRDSPLPPGPSCIFPLTLVASTMSARRENRLIARPTNSSEVPAW
jgi:hypothetical protein